MTVPDRIACIVSVNGLPQSESLALQMKKGLDQQYQKPGQGPPHK